MPKRLQGFRLLNLSYWLNIAEVGALCGVTYISNKENYGELCFQLNRNMRFVASIGISFYFSGAREDLYSVHDKFSYTHAGSCKVGSPSYTKCTKSAVQTSPFHNEHDQHYRPYNLLLEASIIVP